MPPPGVPWVAVCHGGTKVAPPGLSHWQVKYETTELQESGSKGDTTGEPRLAGRSGEVS